MSKPKRKSKQSLKVIANIPNHNLLLFTFPEPINVKPHDHIVKLLTSNTQEQASTDKLFVCEKCKKHFALKQTLSRHQIAAVCEKRKSKVCPVCKQKFDRPAKMLQHLQKQHPNAKLNVKEGDRSPNDESGTVDNLHVNLESVNPPVHEGSRISDNTTNECTEGQYMETNVVATQLGPISPIGDIVQIGPSKSAKNQPTPVVVVPPIVESPPPFPESILDDCQECHEEVVFKSNDGIENSQQVENFKKDITQFEGQYDKEVDREFNELSETQNLSIGPSKRAKNLFPESIFDESDETQCWQADLFFKSNDKLFVCEKCKKHFALKQTLSRHQIAAVCEKRKSKVCPVCKQKFDRPAKMLQHLQKQHPNVELNVKEGGRSPIDESGTVDNLHVNLESVNPPVHEGSRISDNTTNECTEGQYMETNVVATQFGPISPIGDIVQIGPSKSAENQPTPVVVVPPIVESPPPFPESILDECHEEVVFKSNDGIENSQQVENLKKDITQFEGKYDKEVGKEFIELSETQNLSIGPSKGAKNLPTPEVVVFPLIVESPSLFPESMFDEYEETQCLQADLFFKTNNGIENAQESESFANNIHQFEGKNDEEETLIGTQFMECIKTQAITNALTKNGVTSSTRLKEVCNLQGSVKRKALVLLNFEKKLQSAAKKAKLYLGDSDDINCLTNEVV